MNETYSDFPLSRETRKQKLKQILEDDDVVGSVIIPGKGKCNVYNIPLQYLSYNPHNSRLLTYAKTFESRLGCELSDEDPEHVKLIEQVIWKQKTEKNESTIQSLIRDGQIQPGVVTSDGVILSGNRRFSLLWHIARNSEKYPNGIDSATFFRAAILRSSLEKREILRYESFYQYGTEDKVDYSPIQKYLAAHEQQSQGFSNEEIANNFLSLTDGKTSEVQKWLDVYNLMIEYLDFIGEPEIYTALDSQEEAFLRLRDDLRSMQQGKIHREGWDVAEEDLQEYKAIFFNFIWLKGSTHNTRLFQKIFLDKNEWERFKSEVFSVVDNAAIASFEEYRESNPEEDEISLSNTRSGDYKEKTGAKLDEIYKHENARIVDKAEAETPQRLSEQIQRKLERLEIRISEMPAVDFDEEFVDRVRLIAKISGRLKQTID